MVKGLTNRASLDRAPTTDLVLNILSFAGGENTIGEDQELASNEARIIKNWDVTSLGGMVRTKGIDEVADGGGTYSEDVDLIHHHWEGANTEVYGVIEGDLVIKSSATIAQEDAAAFTSGTLCHAVSAEGDTMWITNSTDNLQYKNIGVAIATPAGVPTAKDRVYFHKSRLIVEGGGSAPTVVQGSRAASGNWKASADTWSASNDAWSAAMPADTTGCVPNWPSGPEVTVFTDFGATALFNFPNVALRPIQNSHGCSAPYSIARGNEGVFFLSKFPDLGVYLWDGFNWLKLTERNDFVNDINFSQRIFGAYRESRYYITYNESGSGVTYPNRMMIYDAEFGRWMQRPVNTALSDNLGMSTILTRDNNEMYFGSSAKDKFYQVETGTEDEGTDTQASYKTKDFSSRDLTFENGAAFGIDDVRMKLLKITMTFNSTFGSISVQWTADRGAKSGSVTFDASADGDLINSTFTVNTSNIIESPPDKTVTKTFNNSAVGRRFNFEIINNGQNTRPEIKKIKIHAMSLEEA